MVSSCLSLLFLLSAGLSLGDEQAPMRALMEDNECEQGAGECGLNALQVRGSLGSEDFDNTMDAEGGSEEARDDGINMAQLESELNETGRIMTLYHVTSPRIGHMILKQGFKPGHAGWCGGGIYFATSAGATRAKAIGFQSHQGFLIEAKVDVGHVKHMPQLCYTSRMCVITHPTLHGHLHCMSNGYFGHKLHREGYNSIIFNPGDGTEVVIYDKHQVKSMRHIHR